MKTVLWPLNGSLLVVGDSDPLGQSSEDARARALRHAHTVLVQHAPEGAGLIAANSHPDFQSIQPEGSATVIKVDQIRGLIEWAAAKPQIASVKVALIFPAHRMNLQAANALLKTLEAPRLNLLFILVTHQPSFLPATVRSRCFWITVPPYTQALVPASLKSQVFADLRALKAQEKDPISLGQQWIKADLSTILDCMVMLLREAFAEGPMNGYREKRKWAFYQEILKAKASLLSTASPNAQLLIESLLIQYRSLE